MSLEIVRQVDREFPDYLQKNVGESCHWFTIKVIERLRAAGHSAFHICKTRGEGQYVPKGFQPRTVIGLDGKPYVCTGVSHDAIWCDDEQIDTAARANDSDEPIFNQDGTPMTAIPVWNVIPRQHWRPNNPPLKLDPVVITPPPPPAPVLQFPPRDEWRTFFTALDAEYKRRGRASRIPRGAGDELFVDNEGLYVWMPEYMRHRLMGKNATEATALVMADIDKAWS